MAGRQKCPYCGYYISNGVKKCSQCKSEIDSFWTDIDGFDRDEGLKKQPFLRDSTNRCPDFAELDREKKNTGWFLPIFILAFSVLLMSFLIVFLGMRQGADIEIVDLLEPASEDSGFFFFTENNSIAESSNNNEAQISEEESANEETEAHEFGPLNLSLLEEALFSWLVERVNDPELILLHKSALEDTESFIEQQSTGVTIIIYAIESTEDNFAAVLLGYPFTEWSVRAIFAWKDSRWEFLREESVY